MKHLSLFSGGCGGDLAYQHILKWETVGYVEWDNYCQKIIAQRIADGVLREAPIFGDIRAFNSEGFAEEYKGMVDVVEGGFPCQDVSCAWAGNGLLGDKSGLWYEMLKTIDTILPRFVWIENVYNLRKRGLAQIIRDLAGIGYCTKNSVLSASDVGAPHDRKRVWLLGWREWTPVVFAGDCTESCGLCEEPICSRCTAHYSECPCPGPNSEDDGWDIREEDWNFVAYPDSARREKQRRSSTISKEHAAAECFDWWSTEPRVGRVANGLAYRVDRLKALGNGQVPAVAAKAWHLLTEGLNDEFTRC